MENSEIMIDMGKKTSEEETAEKRMAELIFKLDHTMPTSDEYKNLLKEIFGDDLSADSFVNAPVYGAYLDRIKIGKRVYINSNFLAMAQGGIIIEDEVVIAANVQLLTNNHDPYERNMLTCKPIFIGQGAWIGAGATILPGIKIGKYAIVGAASVVTKDVPDYAVVVGSPAKIVKTLDAEKFK